MKHKLNGYLKKACTLIIISSFIFIISCNNAGGSNTNTDDDLNNADTTADETVPEELEKEKPYLGYEFPAADYDGRTINILNLDPVSVHWAFTPLVAEEETGEPINDAVYLRNSIVEDKLNVNINEVLRLPFSGASSTIRNFVMAGTNEYDMVVYCSSDSGPLVTSQVFHNLKTLNSIDLSKPWWDQQANNSFTLGDSLYFTVSDASVVTNDSIWVVYFNKDIHRDLGLDDPYIMVKENRWTLDAMYEMSREAAILTSGGSSWTMDDQWGVSTHVDGAIGYLIGAGENIIAKDSNGFPVYAIPTERTALAFDKIRQLFDGSNGILLNAQNDSSIPGRTAQLDHSTKTFTNNKSLFMTECLSHARALREMNSDFGILPNPKLDELQENYYSMMIMFVSVFGIPSTAEDPEMTATVLEALTAVSSTTLMKSYYDVTLNGKVVRDEESLEMLDIIRANRIYDLAGTYGWGNMYDTYRSELAKPSSATSPFTIYEKNSAKVETAIDKMLEIFNK